MREYSVTPQKTTPKYGLSIVVYIQTDVHMYYIVAVKNICDWACKNQPCEHIKIVYLFKFFLSYLINDLC